MAETVLEVAFEQDEGAPRGGWDARRLRHSSSAESSMFLRDFLLGVESAET